MRIPSKVITQVVVSLKVGHCSPSLVAELVRQQVGFEVVLLDSKCFPILESETIAATDFWKSNRKVLAASKSLYVKLTGSSAGPERPAVEERESQSDSDFDLPAVNFRSSNTD